MDRLLNNVSINDAENSGWNILKDCGTMEVIHKAVLGSPGDEYMMKSIKRIKVPGGWLYNTTTEKREFVFDGIGNYCNNRTVIAEALAFVSDPNAGSIS